MGGPLGISFAAQVRASRFWSRKLIPFAKWYAGVAGYRRMGLKYDDLLLEERPDVQKALSRLSAREAYDRAYRIRLASQCSVLHKDLPKEQWVTPEEDVRYLAPNVREVAQEENERTYWDTVQVIEKKHH
ncbi:cytochrome bd ubiquinol oxidase [Hysterangium stoloniferum]|nr:cytochrome bd ubiquinol oxidase [Hysterangium stoloniferum]